MATKKKTPPKKKAPQKKSPIQQLLENTPLQASQANECFLPKSTHMLDALPDRVDLRDWEYRPTLAPLPDQIVNCDHVPEILDQGTEGACTGFALAAVINFLLHARNRKRSVSPRMLYEMARRYDKWPGENYEGSSARGAMKGWVAHGVCQRSSWPDHERELGHFDPELAEESKETPGGAYYRVAHRNIRDMHAAISEVGIVYVTLMVHEGWFDPAGAKVNIHYVESGNVRERTLPTIKREGRATGGHAIALVGYTRDGFIVQNSWGARWGEGGYALLPYEDYIMHAVDVWVAQLGVPVATDRWDADTTAGLSRAQATVPLSDIRPYVVDVANNGELSLSGKYWTTPDDLRRLFETIIPEKTRGWNKKRVLLYCHGGLGDEASSAKRVLAYRDVCLANEIYPIHIMWETGFRETLRGIWQDLFTDVDDRAQGIGDWLNRFREGVTEGADRGLELTVAWPGGKLWREMKENARLISNHPHGLGGMQLMAKNVADAVKNLDDAEKKDWELHVVGHSAGSIVAAHALDHLLNAGIDLKTVQFLAAAISIEQFKNLMLQQIKDKKCPLPSMYILSDQAERDDTVGPYRKSLLYLVSNAFEDKRGTPILGMERFLRPTANELNRGLVDADLAELYKSSGNDKQPALVVAGEHDKAPNRSDSRTHGGFDNDEATMNSVLQRILGAKPARPFSRRDLNFE